MGGPAGGSRDRVRTKVWRGGDGSAAAETAAPRVASLAFPARRRRRKKGEEEEEEETDLPLPSIRLPHLQGFCPQRVNESRFPLNAEGDQRVKKTTMTKPADVVKFSARKKRTNEQGQ